MNIKLEWFEFHGAAQVGLQRWAQSEARGMNHASTYSRDYLRRLVEEVVGACGERCVCKSCNIYWDGSVNTFHAIADIMGAGVEIRTTDLDDGRMIIRDNDDGARIFILVTGKGPEFKIRGWLYGSECKKPAWESNPNGYRPAWFVPQCALRSFSIIRERVVAGSLRRLENA